MAVSAGITKDSSDLVFSLYPVRTKAVVTNPVRAQEFMQTISGSKVTGQCIENFVKNSRVTTSVVCYVRKGAQAPFI